MNTGPPKGNSFKGFAALNKNKAHLVTAAGAGAHPSDQFEQ